jgi:hypothetical protein
MAGHFCREALPRAKMPAITMASAITIQEFVISDLAPERSAPSAPRSGAGFSGALRR